MPKSLSFAKHKLNSNVNATEIVNRSQVLLHKGRGNKAQIKLTPTSEATTQFL